MAEINSTATTANLIKSANDYCVNMQSFFDLAENEIKRHNNTDFDGIEFLVRAAKVETFRLSELVCGIQDNEVHHA